MSLKNWLLKKLDAVPREDFENQPMSYTADETVPIFMKIAVPKDLYPKATDQLSEIEQTEILSDIDLRKDLMKSGLVELNKYLTVELEYDPVYLGYVMKGVLKVKK